MSEQEVIAAIRALHKPETRWMPYDGADVSFDTKAEALEAAADIDLGICAEIPATFEVCAHCKTIEEGACEGECTRELGYLTSLWPCKTAIALGIRP